MLEFYKQNSDESYTKIEQLLGKNNSQKSIKVSVENIDIAEGETWCVKAKTIGISNQLSEWSDAVCSDVKASSELIESLSWPRVNNRVKQVKYDLSASYNNFTKLVEITVASKDIAGTSVVSLESTNQEYSTIIARDFVLSSAKTLELEMIEEIASTSEQISVKTITINKVFDYFVLPKLAVSSANIGRVNLLIFTFKDKDGNQVGESISVKKANILSYTDSKVSVFSSALVSIRSTLTNRECILTPLIDKLTNYVVYRQELGSSPLTPASDFVQVSPLIERSTCTSDGYKFSNNLVSYTTDETLRIVKFIDRYPNEVSKRYRYLFLFFDADGEPQSYSLTNPNIIEIQ
jgi:hypothetical protein